MKKDYTIFTIKHLSGLSYDWAYSTQQVKNNGGLDNHRKDVERLYDVKVTAITHMNMKGI